MLCYLLYETKRQYYKNLDIKEVTENKKLFKSVKSHFGKGDSILEKFMLLGKNSVRTNENENATIMNNFLINITKNVDLKSSKKSTTKNLNSTVSEFDDHISIKKIKGCFLDINGDDFDFETVTMEDVKKEILNLNTKKSSTGGSIPATSLKLSLDIYLAYLTKSVKYAINEGILPAELKPRSNTTV